MTSIQSENAAAVLHAKSASQRNRRVSDLGLAGGLLSASSVHDDGIRDWMKGSQHNDWYIGDFYGSDKDKLFGFDTDEDQSTHVP